MTMSLRYPSWLPAAAMLLSMMICACVSNPGEVSATIAPPSARPRPQFTSTPSYSLTQASPSTTELGIMTTTPPTDVAGCNLHPVTDRINPGTLPSQSPDGLQFAFGCESINQYSICLLDLSTGIVSRLVHLGPFPSEPRWSPNGEWIAFLRPYSVPSTSSDGYDHELTITAPVQGSSQARITFNPSGVGHAIHEIVWAPDSQRIAFTAGSGVGEPTKNDIYVVDRDGSGLQRITYPPARHSSPQWSPDGGYLSYISFGESMSYVTITDAGSLDEIRRLALQTEGPAFWSGDGNRLLYGSRRSGNADVYLYDLLTDREVKLTDSDAYEFHPRWSSDGQLVMFMSNRSGHFEIYTMNTNGENPVQRTTTMSEARIHEPFWSVDGTEIYFFILDRADDVYDLYSIDVGGCR